MKKRKLLILVASLFLALTVVACASPAPAPAPAPTVTITPAPVPGPTVTVTPAPIPGPTVTITPAPPPKPFFEGKTITIIVGYKAGGGHDVLARFYAKHLPNFIPGKPKAVVENMPGAGSVVAANHIYNKAKSDGLTLGVFQRAILVGQVFGQEGIDFEGSKFSWIGTANAYDDSPYVATVGKDAGFTDAEDILFGDKEVRFGSTGKALVSYYAPAIAKEALGSNIKMVLGYESLPEVYLAIERGEVHATGNALANMVGESAYSQWYDSGNGIVDLMFLLDSDKRLADYPEIPTLYEYIEDTKWRDLLSVLTIIPAKFGFPLLAPPDVPADNLQILRDAFMAMVADEAFKTDVINSGRWVLPRSGEDLQALAADLAKKATPELKVMYDQLMAD